MDICKSNKISIPAFRSDPGRVFNFEAFWDCIFQRVKKRRFCAMLCEKYEIFAFVSCKF